MTALDCLVFAISLIHVTVARYWTYGCSNSQLRPNQRSDMLRFSPSSLIMDLPFQPFLSLASKAWIELQWAGTVFASGTVVLAKEFRMEAGWSIVVNVRRTLLLFFRFSLGLGGLLWLRFRLWLRLWFRLRLWLRLWLRFRLWVDRRLAVWSLLWRRLRLRLILRLSFRFALQSKFSEFRISLCWRSKRKSPKLKLSVLPVGPQAGQKALQECEFS